MNYHFRHFWSRPGGRARWRPKNDQNVRKPLAKQAYRAQNEVILEANEDYLGGRGRARRGGPLGAPKNDKILRKRWEDK